MSLNLNCVRELMTALEDAQRAYPGSTGRLVLYTSGDGALILERSLLGLESSSNRVAVDFDEGQEKEAIAAFQDKLPQ